MQLAPPDRIHHRTFGMGTVLKNENGFLTVDFDKQTVRKKTLVIAFAQSYITKDERKS